MADQEESVMDPSPAVKVPPAPTPNQTEKVLRAVLLGALSEADSPMFYEYEGEPWITVDSERRRPGQSPTFMLWEPPSDPDSLSSAEGRPLAEAWPWAMSIVHIALVML